MSENVNCKAGASLPASSGSALLEICAEVDRATEKFPTWPTDALHAVGVVAEEMGELQKEAMQLTYEPHKSTKESVRKEAVQLAAMALRFVMSLDRYEYQPRLQHSQNKPPTPPALASVIGSTAQCPQCKGRGTIKVLGGGGDYEEWNCPKCRNPQHERDMALIYGASDGEAE